jgi:putative tricarboxylic transport membrane protein
MPEHRIDVGSIKRIGRDRDFLSGVLFLACGGTFFWLARGLSFGTSRSMGPAYFPTIMAVALMGIGAIVLLRSMIAGSGPVEGFALRAASLVTLGSVLFGVLIRDAGLVAAIVVLVVVSAWGSRHFRLWPVLALGIGLSLACTLLFVEALGLPLPIIGPWLGR